MRTGEHSTTADADLLRAAGDPGEAFRELYRRYHRPLFTFLLRRVGDRERAEDLVQEAFVRLWKHRQGYDPARGPVAALLFTIARNLATDSLRRDGRSRTPAVVAASLTVDAEPAADPTDAMVVSAALERLPAAHRDVLALAYWGDLSQGQMAELLRVPLGTVKSRTFHALRALRAELQLSGVG